VALAAPAIADGDGALLAWCTILIAYSAYRTVRPLRYDRQLSGLMWLLSEAAGVILAIATTGYWDSPLVFAVLTPVSVAGFARGFGFGLRLALVAIIGITLPWMLDVDLDSDQEQLSVQWSVEVLLVALVAGYARRISGEADQRQLQALDRLGRLADANTLLFQLHQVTQTLPASLDLEEVLDATHDQLKDLFTYDSLALALLDETDHRWRVVRRDGDRPPPVIAHEDLPKPLVRALRLRGVVSEPNLLSAGGPGLTPSSLSGLYSVLPARGSIIGLISVERQETHAFAPRDIELLTGLAEPAALAIDNARWFSKLRTVGADEERTRIARDLHDRIGQSLAYLAFELDRIVKNSRKGQDPSDSLDHLRNDVRGVIREVRDTLYDLRTDVTEAQTLPATLDSFLGRVRARSGLHVKLRVEERGRLPILVEREIWRVAQEAVTNVERHARADQLTVTWRSDGTTGTLEVADDGIGFPIGKAGRLDSYGLVGMRERAASIGARLVIDSEPGHGTRVRCIVGSR